MRYLLCRQKVVDFGTWKKVFDSHAAAQAESGLKLIHMLRNTDDPNDVFLLMQVADMGKAKAFVSSPDVPDAQRQSGVREQPEICFLEE